MHRRRLLLSIALAAASCGQPKSASVDAIPEPPALAQTGPQTPEIPQAEQVGGVSRLVVDERIHYLEVEGHHPAKAGDRVDIVGLFPIDDDGETPRYALDFRATTLLQNVTVVDVSYDHHKTKLGLATTADEVELLALTSARGTLAALRRGAEDVVVDVIEQTTREEALANVRALQERRQIRRRKQKSDFPTALARYERALLLNNPLPGVLAAGTRVDIYALFEDGDDVETMALLQDVGVVSAAGEGVELAVTIPEAQMLLLAAQKHPLSFSVRGVSREIETISRRSLRDVLADLEVIQEKRQIRLRKRVRPKAKHTIEIITGDGAAPRPASVSASASAPVPVPSDTEQYVNPGENGWVATSKDNLSTFAADVDTGSFTIARRKIADGYLPPPDSVRPEEWVNYFTYNYPVPTDTPFGISIEGAPSPFQTQPQFRLMRIGVQAKHVDAEKRAPVHLTFLVDVSGSMRSHDKIDLVIKSLRVLVNALQPRDTVAIATYAGDTRTVLEPTSVDAKEHILSAIEQLRTGGGTAMNDGLVAAYALADEAFVAGHENRVIVLSDGDANVGQTSVDDMLKTIAKGAKRGITMSTIGFGMGNYKDHAMEQLANKGNGNYAYIDGIGEAHKVFGEQLNATLLTVARDVKLQVEFNPDAVKRYRLIGYENRAVADADFRNDAVDAGEVGAGHAVTALYELEMIRFDEPVATVRIRHREPDGRVALETETSFHGASMAGDLNGTSSSFRWAASVAAFAEILRQSPHAEHLTLDWVREIAAGATEDVDARTDLLRMIDSALLLRP